LKLSVLDDLEIDFEQSYFKVIQMLRLLHLCCHFSLKIANKKSLGNVRNLSENTKNINAFFQVQGLTMVSWVKP
jgi:hypothetical protein